MSDESRDWEGKRNITKYNTYLKAESTYNDQYNKDEDASLDNSRNNFYSLTEENFFRFFFCY